MSASGCKGDTDQRYQDQAGHVNDHRNLLGIVQCSYFDLSSLEGNVDGNELKQEFVGVGDSQPGKVDRTVLTVVEKVDLLNSVILQSVMWIMGHIDNIMHLNSLHLSFSITKFSGPI